MSDRIEQPTRALNHGSSETQLPVVGLGCMGMSDFYGSEGQEAQHVATLQHALDVGVTHWDSSDIYGPWDNERLLSSVLAERRSEVFLATKCGIVRNDSGDFLGVNGRPEYIKACCDASLRRLGVEHIDLFYLHRPDPRIPMAETAGAFAELIEEGKIGSYGLSEHSVEDLRAAHQEQPVAAYQGELSLWTRLHEEETLPACEELGITFVAYSPLGRGFLTGAIKSVDDLARDDWRRKNPRFLEENFRQNMAIVEEVEAVAEELDVSAAQVALAWVLQHPSAVAIPGTTKAHRVVENARASLVELSDEQLERLDGLPQPAGSRY